MQRLERGGVVRALGTVVHPSGKGVNVSRALRAQGHPSRAVLPVGGHEGEQLQALAAEEGLDVVCVPIRASIRSNISVVEPDGTVTKLNEEGPVLSVEETDALMRATVDAAATARWLAACGSLPKGMDGGFYADLIVRVGEFGVPVAVDSSGLALTAALAARPAVVKPNLDELAEATGARPRTLGEVVEAAHQLRRAGATSVLASLGPDGAVLVDAHASVHGESRPNAMRSAVGAGDALLAGFLAGGGSGRDALALGLVWAAAAISLPDSATPGPGDLRSSAAIVYARLDPARPLSCHDARTAPN